MEAPDTAPTFGTATIEAQFYTQGTAITPLTLPAATGGNAPIAYTLTAIPGLRFNASTRVLTGTPLTAGVTQITYTVGDTDGNIAASDTDTLTFTITVQPADIAPTFGGATVPAQTYTVNLPITPLTLPPAIGGNGAITYALAPAATPAGLTFNAATRVLSGTPTTVAGAMDYTYTAGDTDGSPAGTDEVSLTFSITIEADTAPAFAAAASIPDQTYFTGTAIEPLTLPAATGGNGATTYTLTPAIPGLTFNPSTRVLTGAPTTAAAAQTVTYTATDADNDAVTLMVSITVEANEVPAFTAGAPITAQTYTVDMEITALTLPTATGGDGAITYALTGPNDMDASQLPAGLTYTANHRTITGTPTTVAAAQTFTWTAADSDDNTASTDTATLTFTITVNPAGILPAVTVALNQAILPEATRALVNSTTSSITQRIGRAVGGAPQIGSFNFAGQSMGGQDNLAAALRTHGEAMSEDSRDIKEMLADSNFVLPLNGGLGIDASMLAFWGSGEYLNFSGDGGGLDWDGDLSGVQLGVDARLRDDMLVGVALAWLESDVDYKGAIAGLGAGEYTVDMTSTHPYIGWSSGGLDWWATVGYGAGELEITSQETGMPSQQHKSDIDMQTISVGGSLPFHAGATTLRLKGELRRAKWKWTAAAG